LPGKRVSDRRSSEQMDTANILDENNTSGFGRTRGAKGKGQFLPGKGVQSSRSNGRAGKENVHELDEHMHYKGVFGRFHGRTINGKVHGLETDMSGKKVVVGSRRKMWKEHDLDRDIDRDIDREEHTHNKRVSGRSGGTVGHTYGVSREHVNRGNVHGHDTDPEGSDKKAVERFQGKIGHGKNVRMELKGSFLRHGGTHAFDRSGEKPHGGKMQPRKQSPEYIVDNGDLPSQDGRLD
jgi:hypothetical protein